MSSLTPITANQDRVSPSFVDLDASTRQPEPPKFTFDARAPDVQAMTQAPNTTHLQQSKTHQEIANQVINSAPTPLSNHHKTRLRHLSKWLEAHHPSITLETIKNGCGTAGAYGNEYVQAWLDAPTDINPYGRANARARGGSGTGAAAVTALLKSYRLPN